MESKNNLKEVVISEVSTATLKPIEFHSENENFQKWK